MQFLTTTPLAFILFGGILALGPVRGLWLFFFTMPLGAAAALNLSGLGSLALTDFCVIALWLSILWRFTSMSQIFWTLKLGQPGLPLLLLMCVGTISAIFLPRMFSGLTEIFILAKRGDTAASVLIPLQPVGANINQMARLIISASAFVLFATVFRKHAGNQHIIRAVTIASFLHIFLSVADLTSHAIGFPEALSYIRTSAANMLDNQIMLGIKRMSGGFPEPSSYSYYTIGLYAFWLTYWFRSKSSKGGGIMAIVMALLLIRSTSTSAFVCLGTFTALFFSAHFASIARNRHAFLTYLTIGFVTPICIAAFVLAYNFVPALQSLLDHILFDKASSASGVERMSWNTQALKNFYETYGLGTGIGSVRSSSWLTSTLGSMGIIGLGLFLWFIVQCFLTKSAPKDRNTQTTILAIALQNGAAGVFLQSLITKPYPNLEVPFFAMLGIAIGLLGYQARQSVAGAPAPTVYPRAALLSAHPK